MGAKEHMYPHRTSVWRRTVEGRAASWTPLGAVRCRWEEVRETRTRVAGDEAAWYTRILVPSSDTVPPLSRGDRVVLGKSDDPSPPADALAVTSISPVSCARAVPDHWEAEAR